MLFFNTRRGDVSSSAISCEEFFLYIQIYTYRDIYIYTYFTDGPINIVGLIDTHGLPTRNPGTWLPATNAPWCAHSICATLGADVWPELLLRGAAATTRLTRENWLRRRNMECAVCQAERRRRCCVLASTGDDGARHLQQPFTAAPFVHPFRHPSYHATQLRALNFAKSTGARLHWTVAYDKMVGGEEKGKPETKELRRER